MSLKTALALAAALATLLPPGWSHADAMCGATPRIEQRMGSVWVQMPARFAAQIPRSGLIRLVLSHAQLGETSVVGYVRGSQDNAFEIVTSQRLRFTPVSGTIVGLSDATLPGGSCGSAEFGIGCYFQGICIGTAYCLPGDGPGGFVCTCV